MKQAQKKEAQKHAIGKGICPLQMMQVVGNQACIHMNGLQEEHLPHGLGHVTQQRQEWMRISSEVVNEDVGFEPEADSPSKMMSISKTAKNCNVVQMEPNMTQYKQEKIEQIMLKLSDSPVGSFLMNKPPLSMLLPRLKNGMFETIGDFTDEWNRGIHILLEESNNDILTEMIMKLDRKIKNMMCIAYMFPTNNYQGNIDFSLAKIKKYSQKLSPGLGYEWEHPIPCAVLENIDTVLTKSNSPVIKIRKITHRGAQDGGGGGVTSTGKSKIADLWREHLTAIYKTHGMAALVDEVIRDNIMAAYTNDSLDNSLFQSLRAYNMELRNGKMLTAEEELIIANKIANILLNFGIKISW